MADLVLYRWQPAHGLPSLSFACVQVEAYLRLAGIRFAVADCSFATGAASPTGAVPALDDAGALAGAAGSPAPPDADARAARRLLDRLRGRRDLDAALSPAQRGEAAAWAALLETALQPALVWSAWLEPEAYAAHTQPAYGAGLPWPLSHLLPAGCRRAAAARLAAGGAGYAAAADALAALAARLALRAPDEFFFGAAPSSLDALLFGVLAYARAAPAVHPDLRRRLDGAAALGAYVDFVSARCAFAAEVPRAADAGLAWSAWETAGGGGGGGGAGGGAGATRRSEAEVRMERAGRWWLAGAGAAVLAYVVLSGQYVGLELLPSVLGGEAFGEDDDGDEGEE